MFYDHQKEFFFGSINAGARKLTEKFKIFVLGVEIWSIFKHNFPLFLSQFALAWQRSVTQVVHTLPFKFK